MGAWGPAIFSSDTACDVRGTYEDMLCYGHTPEEAEAQTMKEMEMDRLHPEDDPDAVSYTHLTLPTICSV